MRKQSALQKTRTNGHREIAHSTECARKYKMSPIACGFCRMKVLNFGQLDGIETRGIAVKSVRATCA
jgi:hypothetical protein